MDNTELIIIEREPNWLPPFRTEYDGKYVTLFGKDKEFEVWYIAPCDNDSDYEEMVLVPVVIERRDILASVKEYTETHVVIEIIHL